MGKSGPTRRAEQAAALLQTGVISDEYRQLDEGREDISESRANQATIHARQDLVLVYSMLCSAHDHTVKTNRLLIVCIVLLFMILISGSA